MRGIAGVSGHSLVIAALLCALALGQEVNPLAQAMGRAARLWTCEDFLEVESFGLIRVYWGKEKILEERELTEFAVLKFQENFPGVKWENAFAELDTMEPGFARGSKMVELFTQLKKRAEAKKIGTLTFSVWVVGKDYPVAYLFEGTAGTFPTAGSKRWEDRALGCGPKEDVTREAKRFINKFIEEFATCFFTVKLMKDEN